MGVLLDVDVGVALGDEVLVTVREAVAVGVALGVEVLVAVGDAVNVGVPVFVVVAVAVRVAVSVGVGEGIGNQTELANFGVPLIGLPLKSMPLV